ncbi:MAG TPA: hypothetical protein VJ721_01250 [Chthoniobacterales bacterium]|nr:hypothetical protein [Chthoniobacterales bacterium]
MRIKVFYFTGDATVESGRVKKRNGSDATLTGENGFPEFLQADPVWSEDPDSRNNDPFSSHRRCVLKEDEWPLKKVRVIPFAGSGELLVKGLSMSATDESPVILNAPLAPVIMFFALHYPSLRSRSPDLFTSCTLRASRF